MRKPKFLSPSSLNRFEEDRDEFYRMYLADNRPPKIPQNNAMSVGSAFDSYCKAALYLRACGADNPKYTFDALFERSVEPQNRDFAREAGNYIFDSYVASGAFSTLETLLAESAQKPQFEFEIEGVIEGVPLLGKPDARFFHKSGAHIIFDWKVNGFCSKYPTSPCKYYSLVTDGWTPDQAKPSRGAGRPHPEYAEIEHLGVKIHTDFLEASNMEWADQLSTYAWMLGEPVGSQDVIMAVHQIVAKPVEGGRPLLRTAQFASRVSETWQKTLVSRYQAAWKAVESGHIFNDLSREDNDGKCELLDNQTEALKDQSAFGRYVNEIVRG
jgi:hypothetical protein